MLYLDILCCIFPPVEQPFTQSNGNFLVNWIFKTLVSRWFLLTAVQATAENIQIAQSERNFPEIRDI